MEKHPLPRLSINPQRKKSIFSQKSGQDSGSTSPYVTVEFNKNPIRRPSTTKFERLLFIKALGQLSSASKIDFKSSSIWDDVLFSKVPKVAGRFSA